MPSFSSSELITFFFPGVDLCISFLSGIFRNQSVWVLNWFNLEGTWIR